MGNLSLAKGTILWNLFKMATLCNFFSPADEPEDRNCDSPREVRKPDAVRVLILKPKNKQTNKKSCTESNTSRYKNRSVTLFFSFFYTRMCVRLCPCPCVRRERLAGCGGGPSPEWLTRLEIHTISAGDRETNGWAAGRWRWERKRNLKFG